MRKLAGALFVFLAIFSAAAYSAPVPGASPSSAFQGRIAEIHPRERWLSVYSPYGFLYLILHPQGLVFKNGARTDLSAFAPGEEVVVVPGGIRKGNTILILALEDRMTYHEKTGEFSEPFHQRPSAQTGMKTPAPARFVQVDGKVLRFSASERFMVQNKSGDSVEIEIVPQTKIYTYARDQFVLLGQDKLLPATWVRVGGFRDGADKVKAESVLVLPGEPR